MCAPTEKAGTQTHTYAAVASYLPHVYISAVYVFTGRGDVVKKGARRRPRSCGSNGSSNRSSIAEAVFILLQKLSSYSLVVWEQQYESPNIAMSYRRKKGKAL